MKLYQTEQGVTNIHIGALLKEDEFFIDEEYRDDLAPMVRLPGANTSTSQYPPTTDLSVH